MTQPPPASTSLLTIFLRVVGSITLLAFLAALMPDGWIVETSELLGFRPFPDSPLTFYLARHLSLLYGFVGVLMLVLSRDVGRHLQLLRFLAGCTVLFGLLQWIVDALSGLPMWWVAGESLSTVFGGGLLYGLCRYHQSRAGLVAPGRKPQPRESTVG